MRATFDGFDTCLISDALDSLNLPGVCLGLRPMWEGARLSGPVITVGAEVVPGRPAGDDPAMPPPPRLGVAAIARARPGDVIVVDNGGRTAMAGWGGLLAASAARNGVAGVVVHGACRDVDQIREMRFPVFAAAPAVRSTRGRVVEVACGAPIQVEDVVVHAGDHVIADGSGVVFVRAGDLEPVLAAARQLAEREITALAEIRGSSG